MSGHFILALHHDLLLIEKCFLHILPLFIYDDLHHLNHRVDAIIYLTQTRPIHVSIMVMFNVGSVKLHRYS